VIGAGIVGLAAAREIGLRYPDSDVQVLDKEDSVGRHQTSHNSGVVHAGLYYPPGSLKAQLCTRGRRLLKEFCAERGLAYQECGKVVVARDPTEIEALRAIEARAVGNQVPGLRWLASGELREVEPHVAGAAALHSPLTAIADFAEVARALASTLKVRTGFEVVTIRSAGTEVVVVSGSGDEVVTDRLIVCAGLQSDRVARLAGDTNGPAIVPFRGEYWRLRPERAHLVRGLIYPVPDPRYPFLGVHFTRRVGGEVDLGPNAVLALAREGYRWRDIAGTELLETLGSLEFRALARIHWRAGLKEMHGSLSKQAFVREAASLVPDVTAGDVIRGPSGVRAQAVDRDGSLVDDFRIHRCGPDGRITVVRNAPSPAATSSLAIAEHIVDSMEGEAA
jgi:L-2-hydroxyglutarate oxidase LhgO